MASAEQARPGVSTLPFVGQVPPGAPVEARVAVRQLGFREGALSALLFALFATLFLGQAIFTGRWLSPADLLYGYPPWEAQAPPGWSRAANPFLFDEVFQFEPWLDYGARRIESGSIPWWNPDNLLGAPFIGNGQSAVFYPANWPYFLWPSSLTLAFRAWIKLVLAALGTYLLAREVLRVGPLGASIAALTFTYGGFIPLLLFWPHTATVVWLPWLWWATARLMVRPSARRVALLGAIVALTLLAGHPETAYYLSLVTGFFAIFLALQQGSRSGPWSTYLRSVVGRLGIWALAFGLGLAIASVQLLPLFEYLFESSALQWRVAKSGSEILPVDTAWSFITPNLYGNPVNGDWWKRWYSYPDVTTYCGILPLLLAPFSIFSKGRPVRRAALFILVIGLLTMALIYGWPVVHDALFALPLFSIAANQRTIFLMQFAIALLAGLGMHSLLSQRAEQRRRILGWLAAVTIVLLGTGVALPWLLDLSYVSVPRVPERAHSLLDQSLGTAAVLVMALSGVLALIYLIARLRPRLGRALYWLLPLVLFVDLWRVYHDYNPGIPANAHYPETQALRFLQQQQGVFRVLGTGSTLVPNTNLAYNLADLRGYDALTPPSYQDLMAMVDPATKDPKGGKPPFPNPYLRMFNLLNVRFVLTTAREPGVHSPDGQWMVLALDGGSKGTSVLENNQALNRAWLVHRVEVQPDPVRRLARLQDPAFDPASTVLLSTPLRPQAALPALPATSGDDVTINYYQPEHVEIATRSSQAGVLVLSDQDYPGWRATLDGASQAIYTADHALRGVYVPAGEHVVRFDYRPWWLIPAALLTAIGLFAALLLAASPALWRRRTAWGGMRRK